MQVKVYFLTRLCESRNDIDSEWDLSYRVSQKLDKVQATIRGESKKQVYKEVATVTVDEQKDIIDTLERVFNLTNHIDHAWTTNPEVQLAEPGHQRSCSVGDIMQVGLRRFVVNSFGFVEV